MGNIVPTLQAIAPLVVSILQALVPLAWVIFAFVALFTFKKEISRVLARLDEVDMFGWKLRLHHDLTKLEGLTTALSKETEEIPPNESRISDVNQQGEFDATINSILQQAANSPKVALMMLSAELEKRALQGLATRGMLRNRPAVPLRHALDELRQYGLPPNLQGTLELFSDIRNKIIHGAAATDSDALRALDSGMTILRALNSLPNEVNVVYHPGVAIFADASCTRPFASGTGVILETTSPGGVMKAKRIFPTTRTHFQKGKQVAWEWNTARQWPAAWYRDPDTQEIKSAWGASAEFIGRHLDDLAGAP